MAVKIAPDARRQFLNASGVPYSGAKLFYYAAGSTTKQNTYTTSVGNVANTNPIILDSAGRTPYGVWFTSGLTYKEVLAPSTDTDPPGSPIFTEDNLSGVNDTSISASQWIASALTPTYISSTQFSVVGDQTTELHVGRRLQLTVTAGTVYGRISVSAYTTLTTVTLVLDAGQSLDSGLSSFNWSILSAVNPSVPKLPLATWIDLGAATIPSGSVTDWFQAAAPTGWTQVVTQNNKALRVVSGAGGGTGGSVAFTTAFASQTPAGTVGNTTLTKAQIPTHVHTGGMDTTVNTITGGPTSFYVHQNTQPLPNTGDGSADGVGGGSHTHSFTGTAINLAVQYIDMIIASKD